MGYIVVTANGQELERRELGAVPMLIGRAEECDVAARDILLSRPHCRIVPGGRGWKIIDLDSRNGTSVDGRRIKEHALSHGDCVRMGRTWVQFSEGPMPAAPNPRQANRLVRPMDPFDALCGTQTDFVYVEPEEEEAQQPLSPSPYPDPHKPVVLRRSDGAHASLQVTVEQLLVGTSVEDRVAASAARPRWQRERLILSAALTVLMCAATALVLMGRWAAAHGR